MLTIVVASLALLLALAGGPAALAATERLPIKAAGAGYIQAGITSWGFGWGFGCGATGFPGVYTRLSNRGWGTSSSRSPGGAGDRRQGGLTSDPGAQPVGTGWAPARPRW